MKPPARFLAALALLAGCASAPPASGERAAVRPADVAVYTSEADVPGEFVVIAEIVPPADVARTGSGYDDTDAVERYVRRRAAESGANGVLLLPTSEADSRVRARTAVENGYTLTRGRWVAIYVAARAGPR